MVVNASPSNVEAIAAKSPDANVLVEGFRTPIPRVPEDATSIKERQGAYFRTLCPRNYFHAWLADDVALMTLRLERCARIERRERDRIALRAEFFWDDDRKSEAEELGARLAADPSRTVERLRRTPQGCDWLMRRWALLAREADRAGGWDEVQSALAFDLLGTPEGFRIGTPGLAVDLDGEGGAGEGPGDPASVARREIAALRERRLAVADALDRALAMADMSEQSTPELRRLRRHENTLHRRMRWSLYQLQIMPQYHSPNPNLAHLYEPEPEAKPEPAAEPASAPAVPSPAPEPPPDPTPPAGKEPGPARRPEPRLLKDQARREARRRRADRLDN